MPLVIEMKNNSRTMSWNLYLCRMKNNLAKFNYYGTWGFARGPYF